MVRCALSTGSVNVARHEFHYFLTLLFMSYITLTVLEIPLSDGRWKPVSTSMLSPEKAIRQWYAETYSQQMKLDFDKSAHAWLSEVCSRPRVRARQMRFPLTLVHRRPIIGRAARWVVSGIADFLHRLTAPSESAPRPRWKRGSKRPTRK